MRSSYRLERIPLWTLAALWLAPLLSTRACAGAEPAGDQQGGQLASLRDACIVAPPDQPPAVRRAITDLQQVIQAHSGCLREVVPPTGGIQADRARIEIGPAADKWHPDGESFVVTTGWAADREPGHMVVSITATGPPGLKFGIVELIRLLQIGDGDVKVPVPLQVAKSPRFALRGMYAHLHWSYNRPYALRAWQLDDWKRYVDLLTHLGFNTIQIWPMMELLPHPLSPEDRAYLERYAEVVHYAHEQRGMKVFVGSCPNNITEDARDVPIARREYFEFEKLLDPGKPENLERILEYRGDLYRTVPDADGYWVIDSDPGGWKDSPSSDFVNILIGHRNLIDEYGKRPAAQPLIYWMWFGWGTGPREHNWRAVLSDMKTRLGGPWRVHACNPQHVDACRELGVLDRAIYFPYGVLEYEPCGPLTELRAPRIRESVRIAQEAGIKAIQGNAQTPLVQLPNIAFLAFAAWGGDTDKQVDVVLHQLAGQIVSKDADALAAAWQSLAKRDAAESKRLAARLRALAKDESARGSLAVILGDWQPRILDDLAAMLTIHAHAVTFAQDVEKGAAAATLTGELAAYLDESADWLERTGYHGRAPIAHEAFHGIAANALAALKSKSGEATLRDAILSPAMAAAKQRRDPQVIDLVCDALTGTSR